jgi:N-acetylglucosamine-6-phosphate deacetylase
MLVLAEGDVVLPDRVAERASLILDHGRIVAVEHGRRPDPAGARVVDAAGCYVVPGFVDAHVHGVEGFDSLDGHNAIAQMSTRLSRYGVTAFCPTTVACPPESLRAMLLEVKHARVTRPRGARVLPAHLESNFVNPEYRGAQPLTCLRSPAERPREGEFSAQDVLEVIAGAGPDVGTVTLAPELPGGLELVRSLVTAGHRVSLGHSGASFDEAVAAIDAGASLATHLFNRMTPMTHRVPGLAGAVLAHEGLTAELICDGFHVHPAVARIAISAKGIQGIMAITDGTSASGLPVGSTGSLGGRPLRVSPQAAFLEDGTLAGSVLTMNAAFRTLVMSFGMSVHDASILCSTTPARTLGLTGFGVIAAGAFADLTVMDHTFRVVRTFVEGEEVYAAGGSSG